MFIQVIEETECDLHKFDEAEIGEQSDCLGAHTNSFVRSVVDIPGFR